MSLLVRYDILGLYVNPLSVYARNPSLNTGTFPKPNQKHLS